MGRTEKSQGLAPPAIRKDLRAKQARHIINKVIPAFLASNSRARKGSENSELIADPQHVVAKVKDAAAGENEGGNDVTYVKRKGQGRRKVKSQADDEVIVRAGHERDSKAKSKSKNQRDSLDEPLSNLSISSPPQIINIRIITTDTLTASHLFTSAHKKKSPNTCILNMASPLRPGGGVLTGATSQEEFLCARTTLLPSLKETYYRLPELGGILTRDVLVFRNALPLGDAAGELGIGERYWIDVISAGMLRFPELEGEEDEVKRLGKKDREIVEAKMRAVLRIAVQKGVRRLVLGAWGCGAYGNPVGDIARAWKKVLCGETGGTGGKKGRGSEALERWEGIDEIVFAITNDKMAREFAAAFGGNIEVEAGPGGSVEDEEEDEEEDQVAEELRTKIQEMEGQLSKVWNPDLKSRMGIILDGLKSQLREREGVVDAEVEGDNNKSDSEDTPDDRDEIDDLQHLSDVSDSVDADDDSDEDAVIVSPQPSISR